MILSEEGLVYGKNAVGELLKSETEVDTVYLASTLEARDVNYWTAIAKSKGAVVKISDAKKLDALCKDKRHQGVAALASVTEYCSPEDILALAKERGEDPFIVVLDGIEDPHNLGAIIRTAECAGVHGIVVPKRGGATVNSTVQRASAGAVNHMKIARVPNIASAVRELKEAGVFCYAADMAGERAYKTNLTGSIALIIGSEGFGVSRLVKELADGQVSLEIKGKVASLNASAASAAIIYEIVRQRDEVTK